MKLGRLILAAAIGLCSTSAFANWQPYVDVYGGVSAGTFFDNVTNPFIYANISPVYTSTNSAPYRFSSNVTTGIPGVRLGIANQYNKFYLGFDVNAYYDNSTYTSSSIYEVVSQVRDPTAISIFGNQVITNINWHFALETQLGYLLTSKLMPYTRLGIAGARASSNYISTDYTSEAQPFTVFYSNNNYWMFGPEIGLGVQYAFTPHIRTFAEVDYTYLMTPNTVTSPTAPQTAQAIIRDGKISTNLNQKFSFSSWTSVVGLGYYF